MYCSIKEVKRSASITDLNIMPAPSPLAITTGSLSRFVKDEASYHKELKQQEASIAKLEQNQSDDENAEYLLRQEVC